MLGSLHLKSGIIFTVFMVLGKIPCKIERLKTWFSGLTNPHQLIFLVKYYSYCHNQKMFYLVTYLLISWPSVQLFDLSKEIVPVLEFYLYNHVCPFLVREFLGLGSTYQGKVFSKCITYIIGIIAGYIIYFLWSIQLVMSFNVQIIEFIIFHNLHVLLLCSIHLSL